MFMCCYSNMACSVAGITSDANVLTNQLRLVAQRQVLAWSRDLVQWSHDFPPFARYMFRYQECIPCEQLVMQLCDVKQAYTQFGGE